MPVLGDVYANVRLGQVEVGAAGFAGLHLPEVARLDIFAPGWRGMSWQELQVSLEMGPPVGVVPYSVAVAVEPHAAQVQGRYRLPGVEERLAIQGDFSDIPRGASAAPLHLLPLLRGALEVSGLLRTPQGPALNPPEALLALGFS